MVKIACLLKNEILNTSFNLKIAPALDALAPKHTPGDHQQCIAFFY